MLRLNLRDGERVVVNGAVLRARGRTDLMLENGAAVLRGRDVMTPDPVTVSTTATAEDALQVMNRRKITAVFVTEEAAPRRPAGLIHVHDFLRLGA